MGDKVWFTSYWQVDNTEADPEKVFSIATNQPNGFHFPSLPFLAPRSEGGERLLIESKSFRADYEALLNRNHKRVAEWLDQLEGDTALICWCVQKEYKLSRCHRILVAHLVRRMRPDLEVELDLENPAWRYRA